MLSQPRGRYDGRLADKLRERETAQTPKLSLKTRWCCVDLQAHLKSGIAAAPTCPGGPVRGLPHQLRCHVRRHRVVQRDADVAVRPDRVVQPSRHRRGFRHSADAPSPSLLQRLRKYRGGCSRVAVAPTADGARRGRRRRPPPPGRDARSRSRRPAPA